MATKGNLTDISLTRLVQSLCLEKRHTALLIQNCVQEGIMYLDDGKIRHAHCGTYLGNDAVRHMLSWSEGTFQMSDYIQEPPQTVKDDWPYLLPMSETRVYHQHVHTNGNSEKANGHGKLTPKAGALQDSVLGDDMIRLLAQLEQMHADLSRKKRTKRAVTLLPILVDMINLITSRSEKWFFEEDRSHFMALALTTAGRKNPAVRAMQAQENRLKSDYVMDFYRVWSRHVTEPSQAARQIGQGLVEVMGAQFALLLERIYSKSMARNWRETYEAFLAEASETINRAEA